MESPTARNLHWERPWGVVKSSLTCWLSGTFRTSTSVIFRGVSLS